MLSDKVSIQYGKRRGCPGRSNNTSMNFYLTPELEGNYYCGLTDVSNNSTSRVLLGKKIG